MDDPTQMTRSQRIWLHLRCPCRDWDQARFHLAGIFREFDAQAS